LTDIGQVKNYTPLCCERCGHNAGAFSRNHFAVERLGIVCADCIKEEDLVPLKR
jgi:hypothetical protein